MRNVSILLSIFFFSAVLTGCANKPKEPERVNIAFQTWVGYGPFYLAAEKGFCADEGIEFIFIKEDHEKLVQGC